MKAYSLDLRKKIVESVTKGVSKSQTAPRFGVDRATVKRYCKRLDKCGTLAPMQVYSRGLRGARRSSLRLNHSSCRQRLYVTLCISEKPVTPLFSSVQLGGR